MSGCVIYGTELKKSEITQSCVWSLQRGHHTNSWLIVVIYYWESTGLENRLIRFVLSQKGQICKHVLNFYDQSNTVLKGKWQQFLFISLPFLAEMKHLYQVYMLPTFLQIGQSKLLSWIVHILCCRRVVKTNHYLHRIIFMSVDSGVQTKSSSISVKVIH